MFIQFGYVLLFSPAFPLAAVCALLNNCVEIHVDAFKLCSTFQRPFAHRVQNIGAWQEALEIMGIIGVLVNCALIGQSGLVQRFWPDMSMSGQILFVVVLEHLILALKFLLSRAIPDVPNWITIEMAKMEFRRREALKNEEKGLSKRRDTQNKTESCESLPEILNPIQRRHSSSFSHLRSAGTPERTLVPVKKRSAVRVTEL